MGGGEGGGGGGGGGEDGSPLSLGLVVVVGMVSRNLVVVVVDLVPPASGVAIVGVGRWGVVVVGKLWLVVVVVGEGCGGWYKGGEQGEGGGGVVSLASSSPQFSLRRGNFILLLFAEDEGSLMDSSPNLFLDGDLATPLSMIFESLTS